ncbi:hypothetical protein IWX49DRAFT_134466 [Phyllosticta citricarpa]|uniref:DNA (cytosine-5-)-methyltransferase n=1 Tax=Phyllosticta citricarpa TaxID=55181 RepID=A0ABR1MKV0_9PEZI
MPEEFTEEDVLNSWPDDVTASDSPQLDSIHTPSGQSVPLLQVAASAVAVSSAFRNHKSGTPSTPLDVQKSSGKATPLTPLGAQKGSGYATPCQPHVEIRQSQLVYPASQYEGWNPPLPPTPEDELVEELLHEDCDTDYQMVSVSDFRMYRPPAPGRKCANYELEMEPLHVLLAKRSCEVLLFDGKISTRCGEKYVEAVPFQILAIDAYDPALPSAAGHISIQSLSASETRLWYLLDGSPSPEYERYHQSFLWVADFVKHTVDFMGANDNVTLLDFQREFYVWITKQHGRRGSGPFQAWLSQFHGKDFRNAIVAYADFIWKECSSVNHMFCREPLWKEINYFQDKASSPEEEKTIVTPYVFRNFAHTPFHEHLEEKNATKPLRMHAAARKRSMSFSDAKKAQKFAESQAKREVPGRACATDLEITEGDCIAILPDDETEWKDGASLWYGYVQAIRAEQYKIIWLYEPQQTILCKRKSSEKNDTVRYPYANELFLSNHCNCRNSPVKKEHIVYKIKVNFPHWPTTDDFGAPSGFEYFVRQKYDSSEHSFLTLKEADFVCTCKTGVSPIEDITRKYSPGDVVLVHPEHQSDSDSQYKDDSEEESQDGERSEQQLLEPVVIVKFIPERYTISVRKLLRRNRDLKDVNARPNELVWTGEIYQVRASAVSDSHTQCHVRWYKEDHVTANKIPAPYNRDGCANYWYICSQVVKHDGHEFWERLDAAPPGLNQGWDPLDKSIKRRPLKGLDIFCGGGNFGRGLAEGGAVEMTHAIDWSRNAVASYRANEPRGKGATVYQGSVNDYLVQSMQGNKNRRIFASIGDVDFITAGSPCQGFSRLNKNQTSEKSLRNISMVASVAAFIDFYRPKYALLENVVDMAKSDIFPQLLCCLVGMGYQVSTSMVDAWSHGSPQARSRLFVYVSAPGLVHQRPPGLTHSHPPQYKSRARALGSCLASGGKFGERKFTPMPFQFTSAAEAMDDLPWIGDGRVQACISHPNHRNVQVESSRYRQLISHVPVNPTGSSAMSAIASGVMPETVKEWYLTKRSNMKSDKDSNAFRRVVGDELTSTITTSTNQADAINGRVLHWSQHRVLTILEARRAQGFPDDEVIIGSPAEQWKIVGNSVPRTVALALGMTLREAWLLSPEVLKSSAEASSCSVAASQPTTPQRVASPKPKSPTPICQQTVELTLSIKQKSTSRETRTTRYTQDVVEVSHKTTTHTITSVPSSSSTEPTVKLEKPWPDIIELSSDSSEEEDEEASATKTQPMNAPSSRASRRNEVVIIDLSDGTTESERATTPKRKFRSSSSEIRDGVASAKRARGKLDDKQEEKPVTVELTRASDSST